MTRKDFRDAIELFEQYTGKSFSANESVRTKILEKTYSLIKEESTKALMLAIEDLMMCFIPGQLPPAQRLVDECIKHSNLIKAKATAEREQQAAIERRENQKKENFLTREQTTEIGKNTCQLILAHLEGLIDRNQYIEGIRHLDALYPTAGFAAAGQSMIDTFQRRGWKNFALFHPSGLHW